MILINRWSALCCGAAILTMIGISGCAAQQFASGQARPRALQAELIARGDADSLATAAAFEKFATGEDRDAPDLADRAAAAAPDRKDLAYLALLLCNQQPSCNPEPLEAHLRDLDPGNGITWVFALARATRVQDAAGIDAALVGLEHAQRVAQYWPMLVSHMTSVLTGHQGLDQIDAFMLVVGINAALGALPLQPLATACPRTAIVNEVVLSRCRRIFAAFDHSDTMLLQSFGNHRAAALWPAGSAEAIAIVARRRELDYLMMRWVHEFNSLKAARAYPAILAQSPSEQAAVLTLCAHLGVSPEPPAGWKSGD